VIWIVIFVVALVVLGYLAQRFGYDSRELAQSKELELARHGVNWTDPISVRPSGRERRVRRFVARTLFALADWLSPEAPPSLAR
jgi:hypothetical protein